VEAKTGCEQMKRCNPVAGLLGGIVISLAALAAVSALPEVAGAAPEVQEVDVNAPLIREIQFMLVRLGIDPGPIDGIAGQQTLKAVHKFQAQSGLPAADLVNGGRISGAFLERLRSEASRAILGGEKKATDTREPLPAAAPAVAAIPPQPPPPAPDPFAACSFKPEDFRIGSTEYTPDKFLQAGFDGSTARAVASLKVRLDEARQIAGSIGGSALAEVQRQARILGYFDCRLKIEQAADTKK
jgi:peptidoglycan hydrolase-like protein with peptidoglycan-binding domain